MLYIIGKGGLSRLAGDVAYDQFGGAEFIDYNIGIEKIADMVKGKEVFIAVGDNSLRNDIWLVLRDIARFPNLVHRTAVISKKCGFRSGNLIHAFCHIGPFSRLGYCNAIHMYSNVDHDSSVGNFCNLSPRATLTGYCAVEDFCNIYAGAVLIPHITVGKGSIVGAQSCVIKDVPPGKTVIGVPARELVRK